jgi:hypothetical protein
MLFINSTSITLPFKYVQFVLHPFSLNTFCVWEENFIFAKNSPRCAVSYLLYLFVSLL